MAKKHKALLFAQQWLRSCLAGMLQPVMVKCRKQGWGYLQKGLSIVGKPLRIAGEVFTSGLGTHADSEIAISSRIPMRAIRGWAGVDDNDDTQRMQSTAKLVFAISVGGSEIWRSREMHLTDKAERFEVTLPADCRDLTLTVTAADGNISYAHADWAKIEVVLVDGQAIAIGHSGVWPQPLPNAFPMDFIYHGQPATDLWHGWETSCAYQEKPQPGIIANCLVCRDPTTGLELRFAARAYENFPAVEWVAYFRNTGHEETPILEDIQALAFSWRGGGGSKVYRSRGSQCRIDDFEYLEEQLPPGSALEMAAGGGRSSNQWLPFFNLVDNSGQGAIVAIGWSGQWRAELRHEAEGFIKVRAGLEKTHLRLRPGEEIRTPRILLLFWEGERQESHNALRQLLLAHYVPKNAWQPAPPFTVAHWGGMRTSEHLKRIKAYRRERLAYDYYWIDAGWYGPEDSYSPDEFRGDWWKHVGNWRVNPKAHPNGLRPIADAIHAAGMKFLLWVEPERAIAGTPWTEEHAAWFLGERKPGANLLYNLGDPEARRFLTDFISHLISENRIDLYRQDFNFDPLPYWRAADAPDRQGMTEIRYVEGLYAFWDDLLSLHPGLIIDNCASGGRRIDLETISRSIPLWRSDWQCAPHNDPIGGQVHGMGLSYWVPLHGTGVWSSAPASVGDVYRARSNFGPAFMFSLFPYEYTKVKKNYPYAWHRRMMAEYRKAQPLYLGDYYPLSSSAPEAGQWAAYQMHRPDLERGLLMALRRKESPYREANYRLRGLDRKAVYIVEDADSGRKQRLTGRHLMSEGLPIKIGEADASRLFFYARQGYGKAKGRCQR